MCRNIKPLFNFDPPATHDEIEAASLQYVRKVSGFNKPSEINEKAFDQALDEITKASQKLLNHLSTTAPHKNREEEHEKAHLRAVKRFGSSKQT